MSSTGTEKHEQYPAQSARNFFGPPPARGLITPNIILSLVKCTENVNLPLFLDYFAFVD